MTNRCRWPAQTLYIQRVLKDKTEKYKPTGKHKSKRNIKSNKTEKCK